MRDPVYVDEPTAKTIRTVSIVWMATLVSCVVVPIFLPAFNGIAEAAFRISCLPLMWIALNVPGARLGKPVDFDERELQDRASAFLSAYRVMALLLFSITPFAMAASWLPWSLPSRINGVQLLMGLACVHIALPGVVMAWRERRVERNLDSETAEEHIWPTGERR